MLDFVIQPPFIRYKKILYHILSPSFISLYIFIFCVLHITSIYIPYTYKFSRDVNFADDSNLGFSRFYFRGSLIIIPCVTMVL